MSNSRWIQIVESENSVKLRDQLGNFVIIPRAELLEMVLDLLEINANKERNNVH